MKRKKLERKKATLRFIKAQPNWLCYLQLLSQSFLTPVNIHGKLIRKQRNVRERGT